MEYITQYKEKVKCDGIIVILKQSNLILKYNPEENLTVDLKYIGEGVFVDNDLVIYTWKQPPRKKPTS